MNQSFVSPIAIQNEGDVYQQLLNTLKSLTVEERISHIKAFLQTYPSFATAHNDLGVLYMQAENSTLALAHYEKAARLQPECTTFKKNLADFYAVELGWYEDAVDIYLGILKKNPRDTEALIALGHLGNAMQGGLELSTSETKLTPILEKNSQSYTKPIPSIEDKSSIVVSPPVMPPPVTQPPEQLHYCVSELLQQGKTKEARSLLQQQLASNPHNAVAHNDLGVIFQQEGDVQQAKLHHEKAVQLQPTNLVFKKNLADLLYLACGDTETALQHYVDVLRSAPKDIDVLTALSQISIENGQFEDAKVFLNSILSVEPWNRDVRQVLVALSEKQKTSIQTAQNAYKSPEKIHADAVRYSAEERYHEAHSLLEELVHQFPDFALGYNDLGVVRYRLGDVEGSHSAYKQAVKLQPNNLNFQKNLADLLYSELGKTDEAIHLYLDLYKKFPRDIETLLALGKICAANNLTAEAKGFYRRVLEIEPWNMDAREAIQKF